MQRVPASKARTELSEMLNQVAYSRKRYIVHRRGREMAAIIPVEELALLVALSKRAKTSRRVSLHK